MPRLIQIAAGSEGDAALDVDSMVSRAVAIFYLEQVLWMEPRDPFRVLGLAPGASYDEVTENAHRLMKWLHPYMGGERREAAFADRVLAAWDALAVDEDDADDADEVPLTAAQPAMVLPEVARPAAGPFGRRRAMELPTARRRQVDWRWRIGLIILIALLVIAAAALGLRMTSEGRGDSQRAGAVVPAPAAQILPRTQL